MNVNVYRKEARMTNGWQRNAKCKQEHCKQRIMCLLDVTWINEYGILVRDKNMLSRYIVYLLLSYKVCP